MTQNKKPRPIKPINLAITALVLLLLLFLTDVARAVGTCASGVIAVKEAPIRKGPQAFAAKTGVTLKMGDKVKVSGTQGAFCQVASKGTTGWVAASAFATDADSAVYRAGKGEAVAVSNREAAAAGKGFNDKYEEAYKNKHAQADFSAVDKLQAMDVSEETLMKFRESGGLGASRGVQP